MIRQLALLATALTGFLVPDLRADEMPPVRIGIVGLDNYQAIEYVRFYNNPKAEGDLAGLRVTACYPVTSANYPKSAELTEMWKKQMVDYQQRMKDTVPQVELVDSIDEVLKRCDAVMIWTLDGREHLKQATPILKAGKPLFIGRPLASNVEDAIAIFKLAEETKTPCWSCSQHRYTPGFIGMKNHDEVGKVLGCDVYGAYPTEPAESDAFTRTIHSIETLYTIMGPGVTSVSCASSPTAEVLTAKYADGRIATFRGIKQGAIKYSATVFGDKGVSTAGIYGHGIPVKGVVPTNDKYMGYESLAVEMARFFKTKQLPVTPAETLEMYSLMKAADESRDKGGAVVTLQKLWPAAAGK